MYESVFGLQSITLFITNEKNSMEDNQSKTLCSIFCVLSKGHELFQSTSQQEAGVISPTNTERQPEHSFSHTIDSSHQRRLNGLTFMWSALNTKKIRFRFDSDSIQFHSESEQKRKIKVSSNLFIKYMHINDEKIHCCFSFCSAKFHLGFWFPAKENVIKFVWCFCLLLLA